MKRIEQWLREMTNWKAGTPLEESHLIAWRAQPSVNGEHFVTLVDMGLPNHVNDKPTLPTLGPKVRLYSGHDREFVPGAFYGCSDFRIPEEGIYLPSPAIHHNTCRIANHFNDCRDGWIEVFAGMGSRSFAAEKFGQEVCTAVDNCPMACKA